MSEANSRLRRWRKALGGELDALPLDYKLENDPPRLRDHKWVRVGDWRGGVCKDCGMPAALGREYSGCLGSTAEWLRCFTTGGKASVEEVRG